MLPAPSVRVFVDDLQLTVRDQRIVSYQPFLFSHRGPARKCTTPADGAACDAVGKRSSFDHAIGEAVAILHACAPLFYAGSFLAVAVSEGQRAAMALADRLGATHRCHLRPRMDTLNRSLAYHTSWRIHLSRWAKFEIGPTWSFIGVRIRSSGNPGTWNDIPYAGRVGDSKRLADRIMVVVDREKDTKRPTRPICFLSVQPHQDFEALWSCADCCVRDRTAARTRYWDC